MPPRLCKNTLSRTTRQIWRESTFAIFASPYSITVMIMRMATSDRRGRLGIRPTLFPVALWLALTMIFTCALLPLGPPLSKAIGSAFSPATPMVTISVKSTRLRAPEKKFVPPDDSPAVSRAAFAHDLPQAYFPSAGFGPSLRAVVATPFATPDTGHFRERRPPGTVFPRGPPPGR